MTAQIPRRHPAKPCRIPVGVAVFSRLLGIRGPDAAQFRRFGEALTEGDPLMDDLVGWMTETGMKSTRPLFEQALASGIDSVTDAPAPLRKFFAIVEQTPNWVDPAILRVGAQTMNSGGADGLFIARDVALLGGYSFSGFNQTLLRTGALEKGSNKRFAETSQWALDVIADDGLELFGAGYRSTLRVRLIHSLVRSHVVDLPDWDSDQFGLPINQTDMAATLVGALVAPMVGGLGIGLVNRPSEYTAVGHLTRYVGWLMGVDDEFLPGGFRDSIRMLAHTSAALSIPDETSPQLARPMVDDPLSWNYRHFRTLRRRIARSQHLSVSAFFLGSRAMAQLGLPTRVMPWYPLLRIPVNAIRSVAAFLPGGRERASRQGRRSQERFMVTMLEAPARIGESTQLAQHAA
ncbi:oxygenase MpaB family protein [Gordonia sp. CPCC 205333]|uniref:oxygenase MpaB family protein n=1 Tax=Gordonia sp. CPCC 205333 TaxID=3140790 RepID=UPI003AF37163